MLFSNRDSVFLISFLLFLLNLNAVDGKVKGECGKLFVDEGFGGSSSDSFVLNDGSRVSNFEEEYVTIDSVWNLTRSFQVQKGCTLSLCNATYFDGVCQDFKTESDKLPPNMDGVLSASCGCTDKGCTLSLCNATYFDGVCQDFKTNSDKLPPNMDGVLSASCVCKDNCKCGDVELRSTSCGRAYLKGGCNTCNPYYIDLKGAKPEFPEMFKGQVEALKIRTGCKLTVYEETNWEGEARDIEGTHEKWKGSMESFECICTPGSFKPRQKPPRPDYYPVWLDIPNNIDNVSALIRGDLERHPGLLAARMSLQSGRSSRNAYILLMGTTGSGKSSAINLLFDNPNVTKVGGLESTTSNIHEFRIPVPVDELGIQNSELRVIDTPGLRDTRGLDQDSKFLATLDDYLSTHEELHDTKPNVILIFHKFNDNRFAGDASFFVKMLRGFDSIRQKITDDKYSNVIFVLSHFCSVTKDLSRRPAKRLQQFKTVIEEYSQFPKPIVITVAENKGDEEDLQMVNGYYKLPNGEYYPKNLFDKIQILTAGGSDPIGDAVIRTAFRDSDDFKVTSSTYELVKNNNTKVTKYLGILSSAVFSPVDTVSQELAKAYGTMDPETKRKFPGVLSYLQKALNTRDISNLDQVPRTTVGILSLLSTLKKNEATIYLLQHGLHLNAPVYKDNVITGYGYNVFKDSQLKRSPYKLGEMINSDIGYLFPSAMTCSVEHHGIDIYEILPDKAAYLKILLSNVGIEGSIPLSEFKGATKAGYNIRNEQFLDNSCLMTAVREVRSFQLTLNENPKLTQEFTDAVKVLPVLNQTDSANVDIWKSFFDEYGTHVVRSVYGGGSIAIELSSNSACNINNSLALFELIQFAEDLTVFTENSTKTLQSEGIQHKLTFKGGYSQFHTADLTKMSLGAASKLLREWKNSLRLKPAILTTEMKLYPISSVARAVGRNFSEEIQRATSQLFNSTLKVIHKQMEALPTTREDTAAANANNKALIYFRNFQAEQRAAEIKRKKAVQEFRLRRWQHELWQIQPIQNNLEKARNEAMEKFLKVQELLRKLQQEEHDRVIGVMQVATTEPPTNIYEDNRKKCLRFDTQILMANGKTKSVQNLRFGDIILDVDLKPTKVLGVSKEFKLDAVFYGFDNSSHFFTNAHMFVGPKSRSKEGAFRFPSSSVQIYTKDTDQLLAENPLLEFLNVIDMDEAGEFELYAFDTETESVDSKSVKVFEGSVTNYSEDEMVYFIQVDSPSGTYFANGYVCRHEIPPIQMWPNTMAVIFQIFSHPNLPALNQVPFTPKSVSIIDGIVAEIGTIVRETLTKLPEFESNEPLIVLNSTVVDQLLHRIYNEPSFSAFAVGTYGKVAKIMSKYLDNPDMPIDDDKLGSLQNQLARLILKHIQAAYNEQLL